MFYPLIFQLQNLIVHLKFNEAGVKMYHCPHCQKQYLKKNRFSEHMQTHDERHLLTCKVCGQGFHGQVKLGRHMKCHIKQFGCDLCGMRFTRKQVWAAHADKCDKELTDEVTEANFEDFLLEEFVED